MESLGAHQGRQLLATVVLSMRQNSNIVLPGTKAILVPYRREHVEQYHKWMQDPSLQESTASDPLTLQEEYEMQHSWQEDKDKCTFIILDPMLPETHITRGRGGGMAGDVNLFLNDHEDKATAEIEVMIAEPRSRRKGVASEALIMFMLYAIAELGLKKFVAKIGVRNVPSQQLFYKLGFREQSRNAVFKEITYSLEISEPIRNELLERLPRAMPPFQLYDQPYRPY